jgi:hypothetical protein
MDLNIESSLYYLQEIYHECKKYENGKMEYKKWIQERVTEKYCHKVNATIKKIDILCEMAHRITILNYLKRIGWIEKDETYVSLMETNKFVQFMKQRNETLSFYMNTKIESLEKNYQIFDPLNQWNPNLFEDGNDLDDKLEKEFLQGIMYLHSPSF